MCMDDIKWLANKEKELGSDINNKNIDGSRNGIWHRKMCHAHNEKRKMTNNRRNRTAKSRKNQNTWRKWKLRILGNIRSEHHQTSRDKRKNKKRVPQINEKLSWNLPLKQKSHQRNKHQDRKTPPPHTHTHLVRFLRPFFKWTRNELRQMDQRTRKLITMHHTLDLRDGIDYMSEEKKKR